MTGLDAGERAAIELALERGTDLLLVDERKARQIAQARFGLKVTGTLGVLRGGHLAGHIDGQQAYFDLCSITTFYRNAEVERVYLASLTR